MDDMDLKAWQLIVQATGVNDLMAALQHIGLKAGVLIPDPVPGQPVTGSEYPVDAPGTNGDGTRAHDAEAAPAE